jgi:hypothetical protein
VGEKGWLPGQTGATGERFGSKEGDRGALSTEKGTLSIDKGTLSIDKGTLCRESVHFFQERGPLSPQA